MDYTSYGVGTSVVCSTGLGNAKASTRGTDDGTVHAFFVPISYRFTTPRIINLNTSPDFLYQGRMKAIWRDDIAMRRFFPLFIGVAAILIIVALMVGSHKRNTRDNTQRTKIEGTTAVLRNSVTNIKLSEYVINFFMENSASMDGYVNGTTEFKDVLGKMIVSSHHYCKSTDFYFVNNAIYKADGNAISFIQMLNPAKIKVGNVGSTDVNHIFRNILAKTNKDTVSVLFSDCIYSVKNVTNELDNSKNATTDAFLTTMKRFPTLASIILQFGSQFSGFYYDRNDTPHMCNSYRPFYVIMSGDKDVLRKIYTDFKIKDLPGLKNVCFLSSDSWTLDEKTACTIISDYSNARRIKTNKHNFLDIESIDLDRTANSLQFALGIDGSNIFTDSSYLLDPTNYSVVPADYKVIAVNPASQSVIGDFSIQPKMPYAISIQVPVGNFAPSITLALNKGIPAWVKKANVEDDAGMVPSSDKSFAIQKMVEGISAAYSTDYDNYFKLQVNINKYNR